MVIFVHEVFFQYLRRILKEIKHAYYIDFCLLESGENKEQWPYDVNVDIATQYEVCENKL